MAHDRRHQGSDRRLRSRSPARGDRARHSHKRRASPVYDKPLPFSARLLDKHDFKTYRPLFASYLDIQKQIDVTQIPEGETKGRWKSFIKKWNRGELAEGWYDPDRLRQASQYVASQPASSGLKDEASPARQDASDDEDDYGPAPAVPRNTAGRAGPSIPTTDDLASRREVEREDCESAHALAKASRRADARLEKQRLDDLAPRAEPGTRERQLEKKREIAASNRAFAESKGGGTGSNMVEIGEADLMGGGDDDSLEGIRKRKREEERKLSERELRREEYARARREEMDERKRAFAEKEEERTKRYIELAKRSFG